jgi:tyrosine-protein kinase Etk/Wzc
VAKAPKTPKAPRRRGRTKGEISVDDLGGRSDGGLLIRNPDGEPMFTVNARVASSMRFLMARVRFTQGTELPERLAITSAQVGEGVTYVSRALGSVVAYDTGRTVAIVDCNWSVPRAGVDARPGLADLVDHRASLDEIVIPTSNERLALVPPGVVPIARRAGLGSSDALEEALRTIGERYEHLLLDLPPVLASSEAISLAECADSYLLVVRQGSTPSARVDDAIDEMRGHESLGVVLNRYRTRIPKVVRRLIET